MKRFSSFKLLIAVFALQFHSGHHFPYAEPPLSTPLHHRLSKDKDWVLLTLPSSEALPEDIQKMLTPFIFKSIMQGWDFPLNLQSMYFISLIQHLNSVLNSHSFHIQMSYLANEQSRFHKGKNHVSHFMCGLRILPPVGTKHVFLHIYVVSPGRLHFSKVMFLKMHTQGLCSKKTLPCGIHTSPGPIQPSRS